MKKVDSSQIHFELADQNDAAVIASIMRVAQETAACKDFYVVSSIERVEWKLQGNSFAFLAKHGCKTVGFFLFEMPGLDHRENPGYDIGLSERELKRVLCMDSVAVLPEYRGMGLQRKMASLGEEEGLKRGFSIFMATADPRNTPSVRNFILDGYDIVCIKENYFDKGIPRAVFLKRADGEKMQFDSTGDGIVLE